MKLKLKRNFEKEMKKRDIKNEILHHPKTYIDYYKGYYIMNEDNHYCVIGAYTGEWELSADTVQDARQSIDLLDECPFN